MKVEVGQVWSYHEWSHVYKITKIDLDPRRDSYRVWAEVLQDGAVIGSEQIFGYLSLDGTPRWGSEWVCDKSYKEKSFIRIGMKTLRKRMRDQVAASLLADKS